MTIPVKLFRSTDANAPTLNGSAGSLIALLDACLVDGYNAKAVQGITRSGQTATVTFALAHGFAADGLTVVRHAGFDQAEYNGDFRISNVTANSYDIAVSGSPATPGTGTATAKVAPVDWVKAHTGTDKAAYRSNALDATRLLLKVRDDNPNADGNRSATMTGYEAMTDVDTGSGWGSVLYLNKSSVSDSSSRKWQLVADDRELFLFYATTPAYPDYYRTFHFGDFASELASDPYGCLMYGDIGAAYDEYTNSGHSNLVSGSYSTNFNGHTVARTYTQTGGAAAVGKMSLNPVQQGNFDIGHTGIALAYPQAGNNQLYLSPVFVYHPSNTAQLIRGRLGGIYVPWHTRPLGNGNKNSDISSLPGRTLYAVGTVLNTNNGDRGETLVDITGPWR